MIRKKIDSIKQSDSEFPLRTEKLIEELDRAPFIRFI